MTANRPTAPGGGRPHNFSGRLTNHEKAWVDAHRGTLSVGQFLVTCLHEVQAIRAQEEHREQLGDTD